MRRNSNWKAEIRELPGGARQSEADSELAFERLTEDTLQIFLVTKVTARLINCIV